ncbi:MAG: BolA family transcriptional regulator [Bdellovibrionaceae bacterium]|nr:BolA family transcriptional regulator [Pseudobdellovibrionaceae bacterium]
MTVQRLLERNLQEGLEPVVLKIINESPNHNVPEGSESHFHVLIVSEKFEGLNLIKRHQIVHQLVAKELETIHAFSQKTLTPEEFKKEGGVLPPSPACVHKSKDQ